MSLDLASGLDTEAAAYLSGKYGEGKAQRCLEAAQALLYEQHRTMEKDCVRAVVAEALNDGELTDTAKRERIRSKWEDLQVLLPPSDDLDGEAVGGLDRADQLRGMWIACRALFTDRSLWDGLATEQGLTKLQAMLRGEKGSPFSLWFASFDDTLHDLGQAVTSTPTRE